MANVITVDVYRIDNQNLVSALSIGFPAAELFFEETDFVVNGTQMNSTIIFSGRRYFVAETVVQLDTLANAGGGGGGVETVTGGLVDNTYPANPVVNLPYKVYAALLSQSIQGSGVLVIGVQYRIKINSGGGDFANVGASANTTGTVFIATGTTPTSWTNSTLQRLDPVVTVLGGNTIGDIVWRWDSEGEILGTLADAFPYGRTICPPFSPDGDIYLPISNNAVFDAQIQTFTLPFVGNIVGVYSSDLEFNGKDLFDLMGTHGYFVEIRVYP